jgi:hypothetical protein
MIASICALVSKALGKPCRCKPRKRKASKKATRKRTKRRK